MKRLIYILIIILIGFFILFSIKTDQRGLLTKTYYTYLPITVNKITPLVGVNVIHQTFADFGEFYRGDVLKTNVNIAKVLTYPNNINLEFQTNLLQNDDMRFIVFLNSPSWMNGGQAVCKLPLEEYYDLWLEVVFKSIRELKPQYISLWNEPDTSYEGLAEHFGCLGEDYESGVEYAKFYNYMYKRIKTEFPQVKILAGELMYGKTDFLIGFLEQVVEFDGLAYHHYLYCNIENKYEPKLELQELTDKPLYLTETSLLCSYTNILIEIQQSNYFDEIIKDYELEMVLWFTLNDSGWRYSSMFLKNTPKLVWYSYRNR